MQSHEQFGERVRRRRMALGMIQKTLAEQLDLPQGVISRLEHGEFVSVRIDTWYGSPVCCDAPLTFCSAVRMIQKHSP